MWIVEWLGSVAYQFLGYQRHARPMEQCPVSWEQCHVQPIDVEWGVQLWNFAERHGTQFPRMMAILRNQAIATVDRRYNVYLQALIDEFDGDQLRGACFTCKTVREFLVRLSVPQHKPYTVAADEIDRDITASLRFVSMFVSWLRRATRSQIWSVTSCQRFCQQSF